MRAVLRIVAFACVWLVASIVAAPAQTGYDRRGGDYHKFTIKNGDPDVCAARCDREGRCRAWSFSYPGTEDQVATCWLKSRVPARVEDPCCVSGIKGSGVIEPQKGPVEYSIDRTGGDYKSLEVARDAAGTPCRSACEGDNRCRAWTYVRPGYAGPAARCFLKDKIPRPRQKPCCISGVVR